MCIAAVSFAACSSDAPTQSAAQTEVTAYRELLDAVVSSTAHYRAVMMDPGMTAGTCDHFHGDYDATVRWYLDQMPSLASEMDLVMTDHQGGDVADLACVTDEMRNELDQHAKVACSWSDLASDRAEVTRHIDAMLVLTTHAIERCGEMQAGLDGSGWNWGDMMPRCHMDGGGL